MFLEEKQLIKQSKKLSQNINIPSVEANTKKFIQSIEKAKDVIGIDKLKSTSPCADPQGSNNPPMEFKPFQELGIKYY